MDFNSYVVFELIAGMFIIIFIGFICYKTGIINKESNKKLSDLVLMIVTPTMIFNSYQQKFDFSLMKGLVITLLLSTVTHLVAIFISRPILRWKGINQDGNLERFAFIYSNVGYFGIPLSQGILGSEGVFYITASITVFNLFVWTHGIILMTGKKDYKSVMKAFLSPSFISIFLGLFFFMTRIRPPDIILKPLKYVGDMNTPLSSLVAGATIAQYNIGKMLKHYRVYYFTFTKQLVFPILIIMLFSRFDIPKNIYFISVLSAACPVGATINLFSLRYGKDHLYASELFAFTTLFSIVSVPIIMQLANFFVSI